MNQVIKMQVKTRMRPFQIACFTFVVVLLCTTVLYSYDMSKVYAWPVPFKPKHHTALNINNPSGDTVRCTVYDINGDTVRSFSGTELKVTWNGRNGAGRLVKPGLYIIKVEIDDGSGNYGKKMIRIIVQ